MKDIYDCLLTSSNFKFRIFEMICLCFYFPPVQICRQKNPRPDAHFSRLEFIQNNQKWAINRYLLQKPMIYTGIDNRQ